MHQDLRIEDLSNESDVEQKLIYPLLVESPPQCMGIPPSAVRTKADNRQFSIGKGSDRKRYYPDYIIAIGGIPLAIIEAKEPGVSLGEAFREARLYANEINAEFPQQLDPIAHVVACNGRELWLGRPNVAEPQIVATFDDLKAHTMAFAAIEERLGYAQLRRLADEVSSKFQPAKTWKPRKLVGGQAMQDEAMSRNTFGATLSDQLDQLFTPSSRANRAKIVQKAYVSSQSRTRYIQPIDAVIRASVPPSQNNTTLIDDTGKPNKLIAQLAQGKAALEHKIILLIGGAGSGKSTFVDYIEEVALPADIKQRTLWIRFNMNSAPVSSNEIYEWLRKGIVTGVRQAHPDVEFDDLDTIQKVYSVEVNRFKKGIGRLYDGSAYNEALARHIASLQADLHQTAVSYCRYAGGDRNKLIIFVLDNCDKRSRDEQLLMFEAAQWLRTEFRGVVILPLREETYDNHRDEPPLDTALKDLAFRIEPPSFHNVLVKRVQLALDEMNKAGAKKLRYELPNSMHVEYAASDQGHYLMAIVRSIFQNDKTVSRLLLGLSGRDLRRAFEMFLEICNSGHIPESEIVKIKNSDGAYTLPLHVIMRVLLRQNRRYYDGDRAYVKNILQSADGDDTRTFCRVLILAWLNSRRTTLGPTKLTGYFPVAELATGLSQYVEKSAVCLEEVFYLAKAHCLITEDLSTDTLTEQTLIKISPAGVVHLELLSNLNYWAALAEDLFYEKRGDAQAIVSRISQAKTQYSILNVFANARGALAEMKVIHARKELAYKYMDGDAFGEMVDFSKADLAVIAQAKELGLGEWLQAADDLTPGTIREMKIARVQDYGYFVDFSPVVSGLITKSNLPKHFRTDGRLRKGAKVRVKITSVEPFEKKIHLELVEVT